MKVPSLKFSSALALCLFLAPSSVCAQQQGKLVMVMLKVEAQGPGGAFVAQAARDLSPAELRQLRSLIEADIRKLSNHKLVSPDYKHDAIGLAVVAAKLQCGGNTYILISSAVTIATAEGTDWLVTHDVLAVSSLAFAAHGIVGQLVSIEARRALGLKPPG